MNLKESINLILSLSVWIRIKAAALSVAFIFLVFGLALYFDGQSFLFGWIGFAVCIFVSLFAGLLDLCEDRRGHEELTNEELPNYLRRQAD